MNILITLYYNAELGGLHDNVFATAIEAKKRGHNVFIACRAGAFNEKLLASGIQTITIDQDKKVDSINRIIEVMGENIDLIHAHPGNSRIIAMRLHRQLNIPVIFHVHGAWLDGIDNFIEEVECVFAVSESVKQKVVQLCNGYEHKVHIIPNYSDYPYSAKKIFEDNNEKKVISLITRIDPDKKLIIDEFLKIIPLVNTMSIPIKINIIGDGLLKLDFLQKLKDNIKNDLIEINYVGWIDDNKELKKYIEDSDIVVGPGRVAIDSFTLGIPVIVVGSQNYQGLIDRSNWQAFISNNFGGYGTNKHDSNILDDFNSLLHDKHIYNTSVNIGRLAVETFFDKKTTLEKHFSIYNIIETYI